MQRPSAVFPIRSETPSAIESRALGTLAYIRASIESSSSMDVPGMAGIVMGIIGVLAAIDSQTVPYPALTTMASADAARSAPVQSSGRTTWKFGKDPTAAG